MEERGRSLAETPTWSVATVTTVLVAICFVVERSLHRFGKWLVKTKRKPLLAALEKIKEELMLLGLLSLILVQASRWVSTICVESKIYSSRFYPCTVEDYEKDDPASANRTLIAVDAKYSPYHGRRLSTANHCNVGYEPFVSYDSMEQLHRLLFVLGVTHVLYCCLTMLLALIKIYSWKAWEMEAHSKLLHISPNQTRRKATLRRQSTFVLHQTSHPWTRNKVLIWLLCFSRQFVRTVTKADYTTLRMGFITNHRLRFTYDFHSYMVRTMEDEFRDIVGISWQLWGYAILCIFFNLHGLNFYFWISFVPAILVLLLGTKIQHVMAKLALEDQAVVDSVAGTHLKPRDELFWFDKPELMLWLIQFISFQNAFEMAAFIWSWWQIKDHTCFMKNYAFVYTRLLSGLMVQFWCSYSILPLYAIVTQMGSRFKKALIAEEIRESLHGWRKRVRGRVRRDPSHPSPLSTQTSITSETVHTQKDDDENQVSTASLTKSPSNSARKSSLNGREISVMPECQGDDLVTEVQQEKAKELHILQSSFRLAKDAAPIELQSINIANDHQLANENERKDEGENILIEEPCQATWAACEVQSLAGPVVQSSDDEEESDNEGKLIELENEPLYTNRDDESTDEEKGEKSWRINWLFESDRIMHGP